MANLIEPHRDRIRGVLSCFADGSVATENADLSGSYESPGEPPRTSGFQLSLQRQGTTHVGTYRYQYYNEAQETGSSRSIA
jgi:hypothetical protein